MLPFKIVCLSLRGIKGGSDSVLCMNTNPETSSRGIHLANYVYTVEGHGLYNFH